MSNNREYRNFEIKTRNASEEKELDYIVEGYASTFDRYLLWDDGEIIIYEEIAREAFEECDFSDCVFRIDHSGPVYARVSAGTVKIDVDDNGLHNINDLSKTEAARKIFEEIRAGNYPQMSFAFSVSEDHYDKETHTRIIDRINKVYDISPVTWPANPNTSLSARSRDLINGVIEEEKAERLEQERRDQLLARIEKATKEVVDK